jgi:hypothetical protein
MIWRSSGWIYAFPKPLSLGGCYRLPNQNEFNEGLEIVLSNCNDSLVKEIILVRDFNTDFCKPRMYLSTSVNHLL